jgi:hypothetical protein
MKTPILITYRMFIAALIATMPLLAFAQVRAVDDYAHTTVNAAPFATKVLLNDNTTIGVLKLDKIPLTNNGTATISADRTEIIFTPKKDFKGVALVNYTVTNGLGHFDCGLLTIHVFESILPQTTIVKLFARPNEKIIFTVPKGTSDPNGNAQGPADWVGGSGSGVYSFKPFANLTDPTVFTFPKIQNDTTVDYVVIITTVGTPKSELLKDDYVYIPINSSKTIDVQLNDDLSKPVASVEYLNMSSSECALFPFQTGVVDILPNPNFKGSFNFDYVVHYADGTSETATVHTIVSNYTPVSNYFEITAYRGVPYEFKYNNPLEAGQWAFKSRNAGLSSAGGEVGYNGNNEIVYIPPTSGSSDKFEVEYCVSGDCKIVKINVNLLPATSGVCSANCVFPGDANRDGVVDMWDLMTVGSMIGQNGAARTNANLSWMPTSATNWQQTLANGVNAKNADLNGDGIISALDTAAIAANYGKVNSIIAERTAEATPVELQVVTTSNSAAQGDMVEITVSVGSVYAPVVNAQGLTYSVGYDADMVQENTLSVEYLLSSWFSRYDAYVAMSKLVNRGRIETGIARSQNRGVSGQGEVSKIRAIIIDDATGFHIGDNPVLHVRIGDAYLMDAQGRKLQVKGKDIAIPIKKAKQDAPLVESDLLMFPNPSSDFMSFYLNGVNNIESLRVLDMMGKEVNRQTGINGKQATVYFDNYTPGMYIAEVMTEKGKIIKKIQVVK